MAAGPLRPTPELEASLAQDLVVQSGLVPPEHRSRANASRDGASSSLAPASAPTEAPRVPRRRGTPTHPSPNTAAPGTWRSRIVGHAAVAPTELIPHPLNPRRHPRRQAEPLAAVLTDLGWIGEVIVSQRSGHLIDGHLRVELALTRGEPTVPVTYVDLAPDEEPLALATYDPLGALATLDRGALEALLRETASADPAIAELLESVAREAGLSIAQPGLGDPEALPPVPALAECYVVRGDVWGLGEPPLQHRLACGDATDAVDVAALLDGAHPRLLTCDPPYGVALDGRWRDRAGYNGLGPATPPYLRRADADEGVPDRAAIRHPHQRGEGHRRTTISGDTRADWSAAYALVPSLTVGYVWYASAHTREVLQGLVDIGFEPVQQIIWDKGAFAISRAWYHWGHEPCVVVRKPGARVPFYGPRDQSTVWRAPSPKMLMAGSREEKENHPTQKPVLLFETPIANHLRPGEAVYDPFLGSGTTLIAAERLGRRCYAMEIDPAFCQQALERWQRFTGRRAVRLVAGAGERLHAQA